MVFISKPAKRKTLKKKRIIEPNRKIAANFLG
jgi:hypothetical protein